MNLCLGVKASYRAIQDVTLEGIVAPLRMLSSTGGSAVAASRRFKKKYRENEQGFRGGSQPSFRPRPLVPAATQLKSLP